MLTVSRGQLNRITSGVCTPFALVPLLRVSRTSRALEGYWNNFVPQIRCTARRDNMLLLSPLENLVKSFPEIFLHLRWLSVGKKKMAVGKMAAEKCGVAHDVKKKLQQSVPLITRETAFCQNVCELILGFDVLYLSLRIQICSVK